MSEPEIREVWASNLEEEFMKISELVEKYQYVAMDTEFPGFIVKSSQSFNTTEEQRYHTQSMNVNILHIIQIGITLGDAQGNLCTPCPTWQFNFKFSLTEDLHTPEAINLLTQANIDFTKFERDGIEVMDFTPLLYASGLVMNEDVVWISFHGGYDFAYLLKMLTSSPLPSTEDEFFQQLKIFFPHFYDIKYMMFLTDQKICGLQDIATQLDVIRYGTQHQAGSDSLVTLQTFYAFNQRHYGGKLTHERFRNNLYGLSCSLMMNT